MYPPPRLAQYQRKAAAFQLFHAICRNYDKIKTNNGQIGIVSDLDEIGNSVWFCGRIGAVHVAGTNDTHKLRIFDLGYGFDDLDYHRVDNGARPLNGASRTL